MKKNCIALSLFALCIILGAGTAVCQVIKGPIVVIERHFDFGKIKEGAAIEHSFKVYNKGDRNLNIEKIEPG